jgi:hypothetical protein
VPAQQADARKRRKPRDLSGGDEWVQGSSRILRILTNSATEILHDGALQDPWFYRMKCLLSGRHGSGSPRLTSVHSLYCDAIPNGRTKTERRCRTF